MNDRTLILMIILAILKSLNLGGEVTDEKDKEVSRQIAEELEKVNN